MDSRCGGVGPGTIIPRTEPNRKPNRTETKPWYFRFQYRFLFLGITVSGFGVGSVQLPNRI
jgi:hypothetical protein